MTTLLDEFKSITEALNAAGIDYAVCGGWAMAIHGLPRATFDIELLILSNDLEKGWSTARSLGYDVEGSPLHFAEGVIEIRRLSKIHETRQLVTIDFLLVTEQLIDVWDSRQLVDWDEGRTSVVSREGLTKLKLISGRKQDLLDIEKLREAENG